MLQPSAAQRLFTQLQANHPKPAEEPIRILFLVAHPDDETISASAVLSRMSDCTLIYLTDGAPRDAQFRSPHVSGSREFYACVRAEEAASALALVGVPASRIMFLAGVDQEGVLEIPRLLQDFCSAVRRLQPEVIITHSYEGGHPDHDTAALLAHLAARQLAHRALPSPELLEMTSYHAAAGQRVSGEFLDCPAQPPVDATGPITLKLSPAERATKARMLGCYLSQWHVLSEFPLEPERLRVAPAYDFTQPPHQGSLWYECLQWPMDGKQWRELAKRALTHLTS